MSGVQGDVANLGDLDRLFAQIKREKAKLDIVFANAGVAKYAPFGKITTDYSQYLEKSLPLWGLRAGGQIPACAPISKDVGRIGVTSIR